MTCDFASIKDPLDEALRTRFICSINNEAVLIKVKDSDLTFAKAITIAMETEDASKVAKETVYGNKSGSVHKVQYFKRQADEHSVLKPKFKSKDQKRRDFAKGVCPRYGKTDHLSKDCPHIKSTCHFCQKMGHLQSVCLKKKKEDGGSVKIISRRALRTVKSINSIPQLKQSVWVSGQQLTFEVDTGAGDNFCSKDFWKKLGEPALGQVSSCYQVANGQPLPVLGIFRASASLLKDQEPVTLAFTVTDVPKLNLLGRDAIVKLGVNVSALLGVSSTPGKGTIFRVSLTQRNPSQMRSYSKLAVSCVVNSRNFSNLSWGA